MNKQESEYLVALHALENAGVIILCETNTYLLVQNKHGVTDRINKTGADILDYVWA